MPNDDRLRTRWDLRGRGLNIDLLASSSQEAMDRLIDWKLQSPGHVRRHGNRVTAITEGHTMQRQFNIELRVDYEDPGKNDAMRKACADAARHMYAMAQLLADGVQPQIAIFSDDYFAGKEEIKLLEDVIQTGIDATAMTGQQDTVSSELAGAITKQE